MKFIVLVAELFYVIVLIYLFTLLLLMYCTLFYYFAKNWFGTDYDCFGSVNFFMRHC